MLLADADAAVTVAGLVVEVAQIVAHEGDEPEGCTNRGFVPGPNSPDGRPSDGRCVEWSDRLAGSVGPSRVELGARRFAVRSESLLFVSRETTRGGVISHRRRAERPSHRGFGDDCAHLASGSGSGPAGTRGGMNWREFSRAHRRNMVAVDFFTVETIWLR